MSQVVVATVVQAQPVASSGPVQDEVHSLLRNGLQSVPASKAMQYSASLSPEQRKTMMSSGYHTCYPKKCGCGICTNSNKCPIGFYFCDWICGEKCLCFPCCAFGLCLPPWSCICCTCEQDRSTGAWVTRDKVRRNGDPVAVERFNTVQCPVQEWHQDRRGCPHRSREQHCRLLWREVLQHPGERKKTKTYDP
jgi:hypothetical protein